MGNIRMVPSRHAWDTTRIRGTRSRHQAKHEAGEASAETILGAQAQKNRRGSQPVTRRSVHPRNEESHLDSEPSAGAKERHDRAAHVCRLWTSQQTLPEGPLPPA